MRKDTQFSLAILLLSNKKHLFCKLRLFSKNSDVLHFQEDFFQVQKTRRNFSLVARYSLKFTRCKITLYSFQKLLITCCRSCSLQKTHLLLVVKFARYSLQNSLVICCKSCSLQIINLYSQQNSLVTLAEVTHCKKSIFTPSKIRSLLVAEVARCKKSLFTYCKIRSLLVANIYSF